MAAIWCIAAVLSAGAADAADLNLDQITGRYFHGFANGNTEGGRYWSEDILEIVKISPTTAYFRTHLEFFNGHQCGLSGVAEVIGPSLIYRQADPPCELDLTVGGGKITFNDHDQKCREQSCGMRGEYSGAAFKLSGRRKIRYLTKLLASDEYLNAIKDYNARHPQ